jgi:hypothetical protein
MSDLTADEMKFFETGELTPELEAQTAAPAIVDAPAAEPAPVAASIVAPAPAPDNGALLERMLAEEQASRRALEQKLADIEAKFAERLNPPAPPPDEEADPLGAMMHQLKQMNEAVASLKAEQTQAQQDALLKQQFDQFTASVRQVKEAFEKTVPDFADAYAHVRHIRSEDLRAAGVAESEIPKILLQDELNLAQNSLARGKNPAEEVYNIAKRYGYTPKGTNAAPASKIATLLAGQAAAKQPERAAPGNELTLDGLKDAGDGDLNKLVQDDKMWAKIVGNTSNDIF